jgi:hypothetical protein
MKERGTYGSTIQCMGYLAFSMACLTIFILKYSLGENVFRAWGWRLPFLFSFFFNMFAVVSRSALKVCFYLNGFLKST